MKHKKLIRVCLFILSIFTLFIYACSKGGDSSGNENPPPSCSGVTITVTASATETDPSASNGSITITAPSGSGYSYKINNGNYQSATSFSNLAKGNYTITAKNSEGCTGTASVTVNEKTCNGTAGPKFSEVKTIVQNKCAISGCHVAPSPTGNLNLQVECNIVFNKDKIYNRAVITGDMPQTGPLTSAEKQKITDWINAGGRLTD
jgi:hypothetical protein